MSVEQLEEHLRDSGSETERRSRAAHLDSCARCVTELALLRQFVQGEPNAGEARDVEWIAGRLRSADLDRLTGSTARPQPLHWWERWWRGPLGHNWAFAGAAAMAVLAVVVFVRQNSAPPVSGGPGSINVVRSGQLMIVGPKGDIAAPPASLECERVAGAERYIFEVREVDRTLLWKGGSAEPRIGLPQEARNAAVPGKTLLWNVTAMGRDGKKLSESAETRFRVRPIGEARR